MAEELRGIEYLKNKLNLKRPRVLERYKFYEMKNCALDLGISTPPDLRYWNSAVGWCAKGVDALADRLSFRTFRDDNFGLNEIYNMNNPDTLFDSTFLSALISACSFIYISPDADGFPRLQNIDGGNATGEIDTITGLLKEGYAVLSRDDRGDPVVDAYFTPDATYYYEKRKLIDTYDHGAGYPLLVPIINRPDAVRPFGHARISRACMSFTGSALRTIKRGEISAEFYSYPQKWVTGLSDEIELDRWQASISSMLAVSKDDDGDSPRFGQFTQASMTPHLEQLKMFASLFAGETGLTLDDLGFPSSNPSSAESIKASHENLRLAARKAQRGFGSGLLNAGFLAACVRDRNTYERKQFYLTKPVFDPIFEADASMLSGIGDAILKIQQAFPDYLNEDRLRDLLGV